MLIPHGHIDFHIAYMIFIIACIVQTNAEANLLLNSLGDS